MTAQTPPDQTNRLTFNVLWMAIGAAISAAILVSFHDQSWWPPDDGAYAHVAERILDGEILNRDVHDIHGGYVNFSNAAAMSVFGRSLVSLRYPLILMGVAQALIIQSLFLRFGIWSLFAPVAMSAFSTVQFLNPTAHWYALFLFCVLGYRLYIRPDGFVTIGLLLGLLFWFRQLTGVLVTIGVVTNLILLSRSDNSETQPRSLAIQRFVCVIMATGLLAYFVRCVRLDGAIAFGSGPLLLIASAFVLGRTDNPRFIRMTVRLFVGFASATTPLLFYHLLNGSVATWLDDTVLKSASLTGLDFIGRQTFTHIVTSAIDALMSPGTIAHNANAALWIALPVLPLILSVVTVYSTLRTRTAESFAILSTFYALVAVHYQISIYLWYVLAPVVTSLLLYAFAYHRSLKWLACLATGISAVIVLSYHAGQPPRPVRALVRGHVIDQYPVDDGSKDLLSRCGLRIAPIDRSRLMRVLKVVEKHSRDTDSILAIPVNPEFYFLSNRRNPIPYFNAAIGVASPSGFQRALDCLADDAPKIVFIDASDKYMTNDVGRLWNAIKLDYRELTNLGDLKVFIRDPSALEDKD